MSSRRARGVPGPVRWYVGLYCACFLLYALLGKGFAYVGVAPVFIGEMLLGTGILVALLLAKMERLVCSYLGVFMMIFGLWQVFRTAPYLGTYGLDTMRDAAAWGYAAFAWIVAALLIRYPILLDQVIERYKHFGNWVVLIAPVSALATTYLAGHLPTFPGTGVTIPSLKAGDLQVHLAGIITYFLLGMAPGVQWWITPAILGTIVGGVLNRGGLMALLCATFFVGILRRHRAMRLACAFLAIVTLLAVSGIHVSVPGVTRQISAEQILANLESVDSNSDRALDGTKEWRLRWWNKIMDYTIHGPYFWTGKGYGINLADDDGFQANLDFSLRSPHNSHLTFLARSGVPGLVLWAALQLSWLGLMVQCMLRSWRLKLSNWNTVFIWVVAYWLAFMINASFDVAFEGPANGIPFWTIFGFGWALQLEFSKRYRGVRLKSRPVHSSVVTVSAETPNTLA